jgi:dUTP pyrophosphatase
MQNIPVQKMDPEAKLPARASNGAVGFDCFALRLLRKSKDKVKIGKLPYVLKPGKRIQVGTGLKMVLPLQFQCEIRPRSGLARDSGITLANSPGTLDPDYRGELGVLLVNHGKKNFKIEKGMRIAQLIFSKVQLPNLEVVTTLPASIRGTGGFGSTGLYEIPEGTTAYDLEIMKQDIFFMRIANDAAYLSNCVRGCPKGPDGRFQRDDKGRLIGQTRQFGCVIVKDTNILAYGFNAQVRSQQLCSEVGCLRDTEKIPSGTRIERCRAIHAEEMAFNKLHISGGASTKGATVYVTAEPCEICAKTIAESGVDTLVVFEGVYPTNGIQIIRDAGLNIRFVKKSDL